LAIINLLGLACKPLQINQFLPKEKTNFLVISVLNQTKISSSATINFEEKAMKLLGKLFLLFTIITAVETYLLVLLTQYTNIWATIAMIIIPGMLGAYLVKREGRQAISRIKAALRLEQEPTTAVLDAALLLVAAAFLITPGVLTDLTGLLLMIPALRRPIREYIKNRVKQMIDNQINSGAMKFFSQPFGMNVDSFSRRDENVIDIKVEK
jgi:UPF0716 protein FxsA